MTDDALTWQQASRKALAVGVEEIKVLLKGRLSSDGRVIGAVELPHSPSMTLGKSIANANALEQVVERFSLSEFERGILLFCAAIEMDEWVAATCSAWRGNDGRHCVTLGMALTLLPSPQWEALAPVAPLRRWNLVELEEGNGLTQSPLRINERILHYLAGVSYVDSRIGALTQSITEAEDLTPDQTRLAEEIAQAWAAADGIEACPGVFLVGADVHARQAVAATACAWHRLKLMALDAQNLPLDADGCWRLARLWEREALILGSAILLVLNADSSAETVRLARMFAGEISGIILVSSPGNMELTGRRWMRVSVEHPGPTERLALWRRHLGPIASELNGGLERVASQFQLDARSIRVAAEEATQGEPMGRANALWEASRKQARPALDGLAQRIEPSATWEDLILPHAQLEVLRTVVAQVRQRARVGEDWGFGRKGMRGLGIHALLVGPSGVGKTMAAEVIARELNLDLYRIDLSALVSKYIGETEKHLKRVFDQAEAGGSILLFDEADALFGKRSDVRDSHDRFANIEVSYLLQRFESYRGLAILTSNMKQSLDPAFSRRIRFIIHFAFPDVTLRQEIWRRVFPAETPTDGLDYPKLARLSLAGGQIRNVALNAAFLAADQGEPVRMKHLLAAVHGEYAKLEKSLTDAEIAGWI